MVFNQPRNLVRCYFLDAFISIKIIYFFSRSYQFCNQERGTTLVLVTHDQRLAHRCRRQIRLEAGRLIEREEP